MYRKTHTMLCTHAAHRASRQCRTLLQHTRLVNGRLFFLHTCSRGGRVNARRRCAMCNATGHFGDENLQAVRSTWHTVGRRAGPSSLRNPPFGLQLPACLREEDGLKKKIKKKISQLLGNPFRRCVWCLHGNMVNRLFWPNLIKGSRSEANTVCALSWKKEAREPL